MDAEKGANFHLHPSLHSTLFWLSWINKLHYFSQFQKMQALGRVANPEIAPIWHLPLNSPQGLDVIFHNLPSCHFVCWHWPSVCQPFVKWNKLKQHTEDFTQWLDKMVVTKKGKCHNSLYMWIKAAICLFFHIKIRNYLYFISLWFSMTLLEFCCGFEGEQSSHRVRLENCKK